MRNSLQTDNTTLAFRKYQKPIGTYCRLYHRWVGMEVADLEAEMYEVLHKCVVRYNPDNGASFNVFLWQGIYNRFRSIMRYNSAGKRQGSEIPLALIDCYDISQEGDSKGVNHQSIEWFSTPEASTEETFFAILDAADLMKDPKMQTRIRSARQFAHSQKSCVSR